MEDEKVKTKEEIMEDRIAEKIEVIKAAQRLDYTELNGLAKHDTKGLIIGCLIFKVSKLGGGDYKLHDVTRIPSEADLIKEFKKVDASDAKLKEGEKKILNKEVEKTNATNAK